MERGESVSRARKGAIVLLALALVGSPYPASLTWAEIPEPTQQQVLKTYGNLPLSFEANQGQADPRIKFLSRGSGYTLFLTPTEAVLSLRKVSRDAAGTSDQLKETKRSILRMRFVGANPAPRVAGREELPGKSHYFIGNNPTEVHKNIRQYAKVGYEDVYPGIDLIFYGNQRQLEYDFVVAPGADPGAIKLGFAGVDEMILDPGGNLILRTADGEVTVHAPVIYQDIKGARQAIAGSYVLTSDSYVGLQLTSYDVTKALIIDPVLTYSSYLGGSDLDGGSGIAVDATGNAYVTGLTESVDFPTTAGPLRSGPAVNADVIVAKLDPNGTLLYSTFIDGSDFDEGKAIAVDTAGNAYVIGTTASKDKPETLATESFPTTDNVIQSRCRLGGNGSCTDLFVLKLNPTGSALVYSTYLGGSGSDHGNGIAVDSAGNAYVTGQTGSSDFPTASPIQSTYGGGSDAFVTKVNPSGSALVYSTYLGGSGSDHGNRIAVDSAGNAYVTGQTGSSDFPTASPIQSTYGGGSDAFVTKVNPSGSALVHSTYLGGSSLDRGNDIAVDGGNVYVTGQTSSTDFPTASAMQPALGGVSDAFVAKTNAGSFALVYSTFLGGAGFDKGNGIATDAAGDAYITGETDSPDFPGTADSPIQPALSGLSDAFVTKMNVAGSALVYSTYLGGSSDESGIDIAVDAAGNAYVTGETDSSDFPGPNISSSGGQLDAFVAMVTHTDEPNSPDPPIENSTSIPPEELDTTVDDNTNDVGIEIRWARVKRGSRSRYRYELRGRFTASDGMDLHNEDVTVTFNGSSVTIPAGSFARKGKKFRFKYHKKHKADDDDDDDDRYKNKHKADDDDDDDDDKYKADDDDDDDDKRHRAAFGQIKKIEIRDDGRFKVKSRNAEGRIDLKKPVSFSLQIGNDLGETEIQFNRRGRFRRR